MTFTYIAEFPTERLQSLRAFAERHQARANRVVKKVVRPYISAQVKKRLGKPPARPFRRMEWAKNPADKPANTRWGYYSAQKAAFLATGGFGRGIPTKRTGRIEESFRVQANYGNILTSITIQNTDPSFEFVMGDLQQLFHTRTGWPYAPEVCYQIGLEAIDLLALSLYEETMREFEEI